MQTAGRPTLAPDSDAVDRAWQVAKFAKCNAIVSCAGAMTRGAGASGVIHPGSSMRDEEALAADGERITTLGRCRDGGSGTSAYWEVGYSFRGIAHHIRMNESPGPTVTVNRRGEPRM